MALSATTTSNPPATRPAVAGCYKSFNTGATCPTAASGATYTIPVCTWSNVIATSCSGSQVQGCLHKDSTRCFASSLEGNIAKSYPFIVATVSGAALQVTTLSACYEQPPVNASPSCPATMLIVNSGTNVRSGCIGLDDPSKCSAWWGLYTFGTDTQGTCSP
jgi:hypothetical protein